MKMRDKKLDSYLNGVICVDFDGVMTGCAPDLNSYGPVDHKALIAIKLFRDAGYKVVVLTARTDFLPVHAFFNTHGIEIKVTNVKPIADLYIDDRALRHNGDWDVTYLEALKVLNYHKAVKDGLNEQHSVLPRDLS